MNRDELKKKLREKLVKQKRHRSTKKVKNHVLEKSFKSQGVDFEKLKKDLEAVQKQGGLTLNMKTQ